MGANHGPILNVSLPDLWSRRKREQEGHGDGDIFIYDSLPSALRVQIVTILYDTIGGYAVQSLGTAYRFYPASNVVWDRLHHALAKEFGLFQMGPSADTLRNFSDFFLGTTDIDYALDCIELAFRLIDSDVRGWTMAERMESQAHQDPDDAIQELNARLLEHRVGYQWVSGQIVRIDNEMVHKTIILPALRLLSDPSFAGANEEFLSANEHLREGRGKEAITEAAKAFESTMKTICDLRRWPYLPTDTAQTLIDILLANSLVPEYLQSQFTSLRSLLESGVPTVRNKASAHGQGSAPVLLPEHLASYALAVAAANIVLVVRAHLATP